MRASRIAGAALTTVVGLALLGTAPATATDSGAVLAAGHGTSTPTAPAPPAQMAELDFLLGDFVCSYTDYISGTPTTATVWWKTKKTLDGHYYEMSLSGHEPPFEGRWVFGWNPVDAEYVSFYWDTWGNTGAPVSTGWDEDGSLTFQGPYAAYGERVLSMDRFRVVDADHYTDQAYIRSSESDPWQQISDVDCRRL
ncbi:DUF1579 family protein [Streptomyces xiamenensis]